MARPAASAAEDDDVDLRSVLEGALFVRRSGRFSLLPPRWFTVKRRAWLVALVGWAPLPLLVLWQASLAGGGDIASFAREAGVHVRCLVAAPLLVLAEATCAPRLSNIINQFDDGDLVPSGARDRFRAALLSTRRLMASHAAEILIVVLAYSASVLAIRTLEPADLPAWLNGPHGYSLAAWWYLMASMPLLLILMLGWLWRLLLWGRLLWLLASLNLALAASHPDRVGGLGFVGHSVRAFIVPGMALSTVVAGRAMYDVINTGAISLPHLILNLGLLALAVALLVAPLFAFVPILARLRRQAVIDYGALGRRVGRGFEADWLRNKATIETPPAPRQDISYTADLYAIVANAQSIRLLPVEPRGVIALVLAMALPFAPVVLMLVPLATILKLAKDLIL